MHSFQKLTFFLLVPVLILSSCKKDKDNPAPNGPAYNVPSAYNFSNVSYPEPTTLISMQGELEAEMNKGKTSGTTVDGSKLYDMYTNQNNPFTTTNSTLKLVDFTAPAAQAEIENYLDSVAKASQSSSTASNGVAGVAVSGDGTKKYLLNGQGYEYSSVVSKVLMGSLWYYQIANNLSDANVGNSVDNTTVVNGQGTAMEHHWDEAFGFFGAPIDFPTNKTGLKYLSNYSNQVDPAIHTNATFMDAFLKGRAAISNKDTVTKDDQRAIIIDELEMLIAASAIHELNSAKANIIDDAVRNHVVSEAFGFVTSLKYVNPKKISLNEIDTILGYFKDNLYDMTPTDINNIINALSGIYGWDSIKNTI